MTTAKAWIKFGWRTVGNQEELLLQVLTDQETASKISSTTTKSTESRKTPRNSFHISSSSPRTTLLPSHPATSMISHWSPCLASLLFHVASWPSEGWNYRRRQASHPPRDHGIIHVVRDGTQHLVHHGSRTLSSIKLTSTSLQRAPSPRQNKNTITGVIACYQPPCLLNRYQLSPLATVNWMLAW